MNPEKYRKSNLLTAQRKGLSRLAQRSLIVFDFEVELAKKCIFSKLSIMPTTTRFFIHG
jgi:hypothetical protein